MAQPKYSILEIERRWLVDTTQLPDLATLPMMVITDKYLPESRLRLRHMVPSGHPPQFKLCKKYGRSHPTAEPIVNIYLSQAEYAQLDALPGTRLKKRRYALPSGHLDVYNLASGQTILFEIEFATLEAAAAYTPPAFVTEEVTTSDRHTAAHLATQQHAFALHR